MMLDPLSVTAAGGAGVRGWSYRAPFGRKLAQTFPRAIYGAPDRGRRCCPTRRVWPPGRGIEVRSIAGTDRAIDHRMCGLTSGGAGRISWSAHDVILRYRGSGAVAPPRPHPRSI